MKQCTPVEMRKNLEIVDVFVRSGMDFVVVAAKGPKHKKELIEMGNKILEEILEAEEDGRN